MANEIKIKDKSSVIALSKKRIIVENEIYNEMPFSAGITGAPGIADNLRGRLDAFWNKGKFQGVSIIKPVIIQYQPAATISSSSFGEFEQKFKLTANSAFYRDLKDLYWKSFISKDFLVGNTNTRNTRLLQDVVQILKTFANGEVLTNRDLQVVSLAGEEVKGVLTETETLTLNNILRGNQTGNIREGTLRLIGTLERESLKPQFPPAVSIEQPPQVLIVNEVPREVAPRGPIEIPVDSTFKVNQVFTDHACDAPAAYSKEEISNLKITIGGLFADVLTNYNFFIEPYERMLDDATIPETLLPSLYAFGTEREPEYLDDHDTIMEAHLTLYNAIPDVFVDAVNSRGEKIGETDKGEYFDKFSYHFNEFQQNNRQGFDTLSSRFTNLVVGTNNFKTSQDYNNIKFVMPMYNEITFKTDVRTEIATALNQSKLSSQLIVDTIENKMGSSQKLFAVMTQDRRDPDNSRIDSVINYKTEQELKIWNFDDWIENYFQRPNTFSNLNSIVFVGKRQDDDKMTYDTSYRFLKNISFIILKGVIKTYVKNKMRTFEEMMKGKKAHTETLFYRVDKIDKRTGNLIQSFFLANSNEVDTATFVDSQVKYGKEYDYKIYLINIVVGTEYQYEVLSVSNTDAEVKAIYKPSVKMIEIPFYQETIKVFDAPPIRPDVSIYPYYSTNNKIKFVLNNGIGREKEFPILIQPQDNASFRDVRMAQKVSSDKPIEFESDDIPSAFQIFRLESEPINYQDFAGATIKIKETDVDRESALKASSTAIIDEIEPNKKYYYTFRTVDVHGKISNPTSVFQIEMVDDQGTIYPIITEHSFDSLENKFKKTTKSFKKFILIEPEFLQKAINERKSRIYKEDGVSLLPTIVGKKDWAVSLRDDAVWNKRFKLRIISKKTGRKLDVNFKFRHVQVGEE